MNTGIETGKPAYDLSIITVCRNAGPRLQATVESVLAVKASTKLGVQHVVVDGASTDGTVELLEEWARRGAVETYVSEPDAGIYDAMNKGIALATGTVLYFLNAGDLLVDAASLEACVVPLLKGVNQHAAAPVLHDSAPGMPEVPVFEYVYLGAPVCHQGYFATAALYRQLGGYDAASFRCMADADFMCKAYAAVGMPVVSDKPVAVFEDGGFSANCGYRYMPENVKVRARHWDAVLQRCAADVHYAELIGFALLEHCAYLVRWVPEFGLEDSNIEIQVQHVHDVCRLTGNWKQKLLLFWAEHVCLRQLRTNRQVTPRVETLLKWAAIAGSLRPENPFMKMEHYPHRSLRKALRAMIARRLGLRAR